MVCKLLQVETCNIWLEILDNSASNIEHWIPSLPTACVVQGKVMFPSVHRGYPIPWYTGTGMAHPSPANWKDQLNGRRNTHTPPAPPPLRRNRHCLVMLIGGCFVYTIYKTEICSWTFTLSTVYKVSEGLQCQCMTEPVRFIKRTYFCPQMGG